MFYEKIGSYFASWIHPHSTSVDPHIFEGLDPDPGNVTDSTDPDPKLLSFCEFSYVEF